MRNWAGNLEYGAARIHSPSDVDSLREIVKSASKLRPLGSRHSFSRIADTDGDLIQMAGFDRVGPVFRGPAKVEVEIGGGVTYGQLAPWLHNHGFALPNLASLPHISVAGAVATGTHGSGVRNQSLAGHVAEITLMTSEGEVRVFREGEPDFGGAVVNLGALGFVIGLKLKIEKAFEVSQRVYLDLALDNLFANWEEILSAAYSVSLFTDWSGPKINQVWVKSTGQERPLRRARPAESQMHPVPGMAAENCTDQLGKPGPWHERLPHFKMGFTPSSGEELQSEYFVDREHGMLAVQKLAEVGAEISPHVMISEIRTIAGDDQWLSPSPRDSIAFHFTWKQIPEVYAHAIPAVESALAEFEPRPHMGKLFGVPAAQLTNHLPKLNEFRNLAAKLDPEGKMRNAFLDEHLFGS